VFDHVLGQDDGQDAVWDSVQPLLVNEKAPLAAENPFKTLFEKQFGK
jgi:hypothetical protein